MSNNSDRISHGRKPLERFNLQDLITIKEENSNKTNSIKNKIYELLQQDHIKSQAYVFSKKYNVDQVLAEELFFKYEINKVIEFTEFYHIVLKGDTKNYKEAIEYAFKNGFSFVPKEVSIFEQERMNFENKFNLNLTKTYHRDVPGSSSHYDEHNATRALDQGSE